MKINILFVAILAVTFIACNNQSHDHENEHAHEDGTNHSAGDHIEPGVNDANEEHNHVHDESSTEHDHEPSNNFTDADHQLTEDQVEDGHEHNKVQYTAYTSSFELFAEADIFVVNEQSNILAHFSLLPSFKPLESKAVTASLLINDKTVKQTLEAPTRKGIYSFNITPEVSGRGTLHFQIDTSLIIINNVNVYADHHDAEEHSIPAEPSMVNRLVFTKEQSWKIDFKTEKVKHEPFGQVIRTAAKFQSEMGNEKIVVAKAGGVVFFTDNTLLEGYTVSNDQTLFHLSHGGISKDNITVKYYEAKNNLEYTESEYNRKKELAEDNIVSDKELLQAKNNYENSKVVYENLARNFDAEGQTVKSPINGYIKQVFVENGQFVETGQPLVSIAQNHTLILKAMVPQKYSSTLSTIHSAIIKTQHNDQSYTLEELNGKLLSYGKSVNESSFLLPVYFQIDNHAGFMQGSLVEVYLKTLSSERSKTIPNSALLEEQGNYFVLVQITPELFEKRQVMTGATDGIRTEIISGIDTSERVISKGATLVDLAQASGALDPHSGHVH